MALAVTQILASVRSSGTSLARTFASPIAAGTLLIAHASVFNSGGSGAPTISDNINGTWPSYTTSGYFASGDADSEIYLWSFPNSGAGTITVTMNPPGTSSDNDLTLLAVTGAATANPRDVAVTATGSSLTAAVTTGTLAQAAELLVSSFSQAVSSMTLTADSGDGFTQADENENNAAGQCFLVQYKIVAATTSLTVNGTFGEATPWFTGVTSFKEAAAAAGLAGDEGALWYLPVETY